VSWPVQDAGAQHIEVGYVIYVIAVRMGADDRVEARDVPPILQMAKGTEGGVPFAAFAGAEVHYEALPSGSLDVSGVTMLHIPKYDFRHLFSLRSGATPSHRSESPGAATRLISAPSTKYIVCGTYSKRNFRGRKVGLCFRGEKVGSLAHNGFEIAMLSLGRADSLLVTRWDEGLPTRVLVDGGRRGHAETIRAFLEAHEITRIDHVVCTHYDDDHAGGLVELIKDDSIQFGKAWVHVPGRHVDRARVRTAVSQAAGSEKAQAAIKSLQTSDALLGAIKNRGLTLAEPFSGSRIGFLTVCGPSERFYEELVSDFEDADRIKKAELKELVLEAVLKRLV
jgi:hypothetical protein